MLIHFCLLEKILSPLTNAKFRSKGIRKNNNKRVTLAWQRAALSEVVAKEEAEWEVSGHHELFIHGKDSDLSTCLPSGNVANFNCSILLQTNPYREDLDNLL